MSKKRAKGNLEFAVLFVVLVGAIVLLSLGFRTFFLLKETKFNGSSHFALEVKNDKDQIISFNPKTSTIGILTLKNVAPRNLEIPTDAKINSQLEISKNNLDSSLLRMSFDFKNQNGLNFIDIFRLFLYSKSVKNTSIIEKEIGPSTEKINSDSIISSLFNDGQISDEKLSIKVINSADVPGLGNRLANFISNMGGNVILVTTGDIKGKSEIQYAENSYTTDKLSAVLKIKKVKKSKNSLADVIIILGKDQENNQDF